MAVESFFQTMSDGFEVFVNRWMPEENQEIKGVIQLCHGMMEHVLRYDRLGTFLAEQGYVFCAHDQRGHGKTAQNSEVKGTGIFGKLADKRGFERVCDDLNEVIQKLKNDYPEKKVILLGHSFGSFVSQLYIEKYGSEIDKCILCGTSGPNPAVPFGRFFNGICRMIFKGNFVSHTFSKLVFGGYNKRIPKHKIRSANEWLTKNPDNIVLYDMDSWCGRCPTLSFFKDLLWGLSVISKKSSIKNIPVNLPVFFIYGSEDPVGNYGKSIEKLISIFNKAGMKHVERKIYPDLRHELFNEAEWEQITKECIEWIEKNHAS